MRVLLAIDVQPTADAAVSQVAARPWLKGTMVPSTGAIKARDRSGPGTRHSTVPADGGELCVAIAAQRQCVLEGGLRRPREVDSTEDARRYGHSGLLQEEGRRGIKCPRRPPSIEATWAP